MKMWCSRFCVRILSAFVLLVSVHADLDAQIVQYAFRVRFADKQHNTHSLSAPLDFLSQRALDRRAKYNVAVESSDLPVSSLYVDSVLSLTDGVLHVTSRWFNQCVVLLNDSAKIRNLNGQPFVMDYELVGLYTATLHEKVRKRQQEQVSDALAGAKKTTLDNTYFGQSWTQTNLVHGDTLTTLGLDGRGVLIAVLDEGFIGIDVHPAFDTMKANGGILDIHNFVRASDSVYAYDDHGTAVMSTIGACIAGSYVGAATKASFAFYCTEDGYSEQPIELDNLVAAVERADSLGADIIHISLGYDVFNTFPGSNITPAMRDGKTVFSTVAANVATEKGILFVATPGNEGYSSIQQNTLLTPGDADSALTVGNVDANGIVASSSSMGPNAANVIKPDVCAMGNTATVISGSGNVVAAGGTSFAAPQITGWAACLLQAKPTATPWEIKQAIRLSADAYNNPDKQRGYGVPDFRTAYDLLEVPDTADTPIVVPVHDDFLFVYPSIPTGTDLLNIVINTAQDQSVAFVLYDINGQIIWQRDEAVFAAGRSQIQVSFQKAMAHGMYLLKAVGSSASQGVKIIR